MRCPVNFNGFLVSLLGNFCYLSIFGLVVFSNLQLQIRLFVTVFFDLCGFLQVNEITKKKYTVMNMVAEVYFFHFIFRITVS